MGDPVSVASGVAGLITLAIQVSGTVYSYLNAVKERKEDVLALREELDQLGEALSELAAFLDSSDAKANDFDTNGVLRSAVKGCRDRIERIGERLRPPEGKLMKLAGRLKWPFEKEVVLSNMQSLKRYRSTFEFAANIQGYRILSKTSADTKMILAKLQKIEQKSNEDKAEIGMLEEEDKKKQARYEAILNLLPLLENQSSDIREVSNAMRLQEMRENERRKTEILEWLCPIQDLSKHRDLESHRSPGTGQWLLDTPEYNSWLLGDVQDLICAGRPGVGKSVLCTKVVDTLKDKFQGEDSVRVAHYYFDDSEQQLRTDSHFYRSILRQICVPCTVIPSALSTFYQETRDEDKDRTWFRKLRRTFQRVVATYNKLFVVIDALDETELMVQRPAILAAIKSIRETYDSMQILVTSRPHVDNIPQHLTNSASITINAHEEDLRNFLTRSIEQYPGWESLFDEKLKLQVLDKLCESADGTFLLPSMHMKNLMEQPSKAEIRKALNNLPTSFFGVFDATIERIRKLPVSWRDIAFKTLMWLSHVKRRTFTMNELQHALAVDEDDLDFDADAVVDSARILGYCCGLVEHEQESGSVHLVHLTLVTYLREHDHELFQDANISILRTCLKYMSLPKLQSITQYRSRAEANELLHDMSLGHYACSFWGAHARGVDVELYRDLVMPILTSSNALMVTARVRDQHTTDQRKYSDRIWQWAHSPNGGGGISLASGFGLTELVQLLVSQHAQPNLTARNAHGSAALHEASLYGHEETAALLISHGADVFQPNQGRATPFYIAVAYGGLSMAKFLLKYGHNQLDQHSRGGYTPLHKAVELDSEEMVQFLLDSNALIGANDERNNTPLHIAALRGSTSIVKMLIGAGAFVSAENVDRRVPLDLAATAGHREIVQYLLEHGGHVSHKALDRWSALHRAARGGHVDTACTLLEHGANLLDRDIKGNLPIHHAARKGHRELVEQLIEWAPHLKEEQLLHTDKSGSRPREIAFFCAHYDVHKYLRTLEWQVLGIPSPHNNITLAIEHGHSHVIESLLQKRQLNIEAVDEDGQPPLHVAVQEGQIEIAKMLLAAGASIEQSGFHGWRCIHIAASLGDVDTVEWCLQHGADARARTSSGQQALHKSGKSDPTCLYWEAACGLSKNLYGCNFVRIYLNSTLTVLLASTKSLATVRLLIEAGADVESRNDRGMTALQIAAHHNEIDTVRALVTEYGADIASSDRHGFTPVMWAEKSAFFEVTKFLRTAKKIQEKKRNPLKRQNTSNSDVTLASREKLRESISIDEAGGRLEEMELV